MKLLSSSEIAELRTEIAELGISDERKDELIRFLDSVVVSFIDQAFGHNSTQISLSARAIYAFNDASTHANLPKSDMSELVDLPQNEEGEGAINTKSPALKQAGRQLAP
jgi:hypothetical protein